MARMEEFDWLHGDVVRKIRGLREDLETSKAPADAKWVAEQMACILFSGYEPYFEGDEPPEPETVIEETEVEFGLHQSDCAGCEIFGRINELGLCEGCSGKLERDLIRNRDWAYGVTAYGLSHEQREDVRRQVVRKYGKGLELIAPSRPAKSNRKRRKGRKRT